MAACDAFGRATHDLHCLVKHKVHKLIESAQHAGHGAVAVQFDLQPLVHVLFQVGARRGGHAGCCCCCCCCGRPRCCLPRAPFSHVSDVAPCRAPLENRRHPRRRVTTNHHRSQPKSCNFCSPRARRRRPTHLRRAPWTCSVQHRRLPRSMQDWRRPARFALLVGTASASSMNFFTDLPPPSPPFGVAQTVCERNTFYAPPPPLQHSPHLFANLTARRHAASLHLSASCAPHFGRPYGRSSIE